MPIKFTFEEERLMTGPILVPEQLGRLCKVFETKAEQWQPLMPSCEITGHRLPKGEKHNPSCATNSLERVA